MNSNGAKATSGNILIIDDTPDNLRFLSELLTEAGYTVRKVINGELGIESALLEPPDLILLDIRMPGMNGYQVCDRLKASDRTRLIPVIFLSGLEEEAEKVMAFRAGGVDYILKPFQVVEVLARIETHLENSRLQRQLQEKNAQLNQEIEYRTSAESALQILNQGLEARIQERTAELQRENQELLSLQTELQKALEQEQRLNQFKTQWIQTITQKFRIPIVTTKSAIELIKQKQQNSTHELDPYLQRIETNLRSMSESLEDVIFLIDAEKQELSFKPTEIDLTEFCRSLTTQWKLPSNSEHKLLFIHFGKAPETVLVDSNLLHQICTQLLSNAVRFSPSGGSILFELIYESEQILIRIRDEGIGIPIDDQERIFERFYRAKNADLIVENSAGLGLAIARQAASLHGGTISVSSEVNRGSTFTVSLPIQSGVF